MSAREELVEILHQTATADRVKNAPLREVPIVAAKVEAVADAILAAGYRKPGVIEPEKMRIVNGYLVAVVNGCTCAGGGPECNYAHENGCGLEPLADITDALKLAGYRRPYTITAAEELDALPVGSVVKDEDGHAHLKYPRGWVRTGQEPYSTPEGILPAIVIHEASGE